MIAGRMRRGLEMEAREMTVSVKNCEDESLKFQRTLQTGLATLCCQNQFQTEMEENLLSFLWCMLLDSDRFRNHV